MKSHDGMTFIEVLVALAVLSLGALAVMRLAARSQETAADIRHMDQLATLASDKFSTMQEEGFSPSLSGDGTFQNAPGYSWSTETTPFNDDGWYKTVLKVRREDSGRTIIVEHLFKE